MSPSTLEPDTADSSQPADPNQRRDARDPGTSWTRVSEYPLAAAAALFLAAYAWPILQPGLPHTLRTICRVIVYVVWALFAVDYSVRLVLAENKGRFFIRNLLDLASILLPVLRPLRLLRLVALVRSCVPDSGVAR